MPRLGRGRDHRTAGLGLDDRPFGRAIHQARGAPWIGAFIDIDFDAVQRLQRHIDGVKIDLAADDVAHPALGAALVIDLEAGHAGFSQSST